MRRDNESRKHYAMRLELYNEEFNTTTKPKAGGKKNEGSSVTNRGLCFPPGVRLISPDDDSWDLLLTTKH